MRLLFEDRPWRTFYSVGMDVVEADSSLVGRLLRTTLLLFVGMHGDVAAVVVFMILTTMNG